MPALLGPADELQYLKSSLFTSRRDLIFLKSIMFSAREVTWFLQVKVKVKFTLEQTMKAQGDGSGINLLFL